MTVKAFLGFPSGFLWGCATAAHQVEGQNNNTWSRWERVPGRVHGNHTADQACEWWAGRWAEDFDRAAALNNNAQRISIEWSRLVPTPDAWDEAAAERYRAMLSGLRDRGMKPMITLHHFTEPLWFADRGGWTMDDAPAHFAYFARRAAETFGDLCDLWCTINEPLVYATQGYLFRRWAPGKSGVRLMRRVVAGLVRSHAAAYYAIKGVQPHASIGYALHYLGLHSHWPQLVNNIGTRALDRFMNLSFTDALMSGVLRLPGGNIPVPNVTGTLDWIGLQFYHEFQAGLNFLKPGSLFLEYGKPRGMVLGPDSWGGINPSALYEAIKRLWSRYQLPIIVTESGVPDPDDHLRPGYIIESVKAMWHAVGYGFPVLGYFFWSLIDNFEWAEGYDPRFNFGLYKVDRETGERTARPSAALYGEICAANGLSTEMVARYAPDLMPKLFPGGRP
jgi:beta-glucosidase